MNLRGFVWVPREWNQANFADKISKDEDLTLLLTVGLLFIFVHQSCVHLAILKIHSVSPLNFEQRTPPEVVNNSGNEATSLVRILFLLA